MVAGLNQNVLVGVIDVMARITLINREKLCAALGENDNNVYAIALRRFQTTPLSDH